MANLGMSASGLAKTLLASTGGASSTAGSETKNRLGERSQHSAPGDEFSTLFLQKHSNSAESALNSLSGKVKGLPETPLAMPETGQSAAYQLVAADGNELPLFGNFLQPGFTASSENPQPAELESHPDLSLMEAVDTELDGESTKSAVDDDIAYWLADPGLSFLNPEAIDKLPMSSQLTTVTGSQLNSQETALPPSANQYRQPLSLSAAIKADAVTVQQDILSKNSLEPAHTAAELVSVEPDNARLGQVVMGPLQLFDQFKLENRQSAAWRGVGPSPLTAAMDSTGEVFEQGFGRDIGKGEPVGANAISSVGAASTSSSNAVESFINVLLSIDTSAPSTQGIGSAIEQWKAEQANQVTELAAKETAGQNSLARVTVPFNQPGWGESIGRQLAMLMARNMDSAQIQLDPPELGPLAVKIQVHNDQVSLHFTTAHSSVKEALEATSLKLSEMFQEEGMELANLDVTSDDASQQQANQQGERKDATNVTSTPITPHNAVEENDGLLTLSSSWRQDDGKIDYFI